MNVDKPFKECENIRNCFRDLLKVMWQLGAIKAQKNKDNAIAVLPLQIYKGAIVVFGRLSSLEW